MRTHEERFSALGLGAELPPPMKPFGMYRPATLFGSLLYVSGHGPMRLDKSMMVGKVGVTCSKEEATQAARQTALSILATLRQTLGSLDRVKRVVKALVMVNATEMFKEHISVANGYAKVFADVFGEAGIGARSAVGMGSLPMDIPVEIELILEVDPPAQPPKRPPWFQSDTALRPVINCCGHFTSLGGSRLHPRALSAMSAIASSFVDLNTLLRRAGERIAELAEAPHGYSALVTTGAAAGLALATAACLARDDLSAGARLPDVRGLTRTRVLLDGSSDIRWQQSLALTGATIDLIGSPAEPMGSRSLSAALDAGGVAALVLFDGGSPHGMPLDAAIATAATYGVPTVVDAAGRLPPLSRLREIALAGADAVLASGGKALCGPQSSGFMLAREWLIAGARANACPVESSCCRAMKTCKESVVGLVAAVEAFVEEQAERPYPAAISAIAASLAAEMLTALEAKLGAARARGVVVRVASGASEGLHEVQPSAHDLVFVELPESVLRMRPPTTSAPVTAPAAAPAAVPATVPATDRFMAGGVSHDSPLVVDVRDAPTWVAAALAEGSPAIATNTTRKGLVLNPYVLEGAEIAIVAVRTARAIAELLEQTQPKARL